jgi:hypothetical protein
MPGDQANVFPGINTMGTGVDALCGGRDARETDRPTVPTGVDPECGIVGCQAGAKHRHGYHPTGLIGAIP